MPSIFSSKSSKNDTDLKNLVSVIKIAAKNGQLDHTHLARDIKIFLRSTISDIILDPKCIDELENNPKHECLNSRNRKTSTRPSPDSVTGARGHLNSRTGIGSTRRLPGRRSAFARMGDAARRSKARLFKRNPRPLAPSSVASSSSSSIDQDLDGDDDDDATEDDEASEPSVPPPSGRGLDPLSPSNRALQWPVRLPSDQPGRPGRTTQSLAGRTKSGNTKPSPPSRLSHGKEDEHRPLFTARLGGKRKSRKMKKSHKRKSSLRKSRKR